MFKITDKDRIVKRLEKDNKNDIRKFLKTLKPDGFFFNIQQGMLSRAGISDTLGVFNGRFFAFECKSKDGKPTPLQRAFLRMITMARGIGGVVKSVADVKELLNLTPSVLTREFELGIVHYGFTLAEVYLKFCTPKQALKILNRWNEENSPPLSEKEIQMIINQSL